MPEQIKGLGAAETDIMMALWASSGPVTSNYVLNHLKQKRAWALSTVMTSLSRLADKGFVHCDRKSGTNLYLPIISKTDYIARESALFLEKLHDGSLESLITALYHKKAVSDEDLLRLKDFIEGILPEGY